MLFHSYTFLTFFSLVLILHGLAPARARRYVLLGASYLFLGWWKWSYTLLLLAATTIDYAAAKAIDRAQRPRVRGAFLALSMSMNLGMLGLFKYYNFFAHSLADLLQHKVPLVDLVLPIGISFYTFESMSYTIDVYRRKTGLARDFVDFALFVSFFPRLIAGPIMRAAYFLPQLATARVRTAEQARLGLKTFCFGLFKKMVVADNLAIFVDAVHRAPATYATGDLWIAAYAFAFQIYCDFSGYSDMAIGAAKILGYDLLENFHRPYCARNVSEFWRRWHISLSTWLRDYLYISLGGNRGGPLRRYANLMITMLLGGLWHGANWTFVLWGFLHGSFLVIHRLFASACARVGWLAKISASRAMTPLFVLLTLHCWVVSMVLFRAENIAKGRRMLGRMFSLAPNPAGLQVTAYATLGICVAFYLAQISQERWDFLAGFERLPLPLRTGIIIAGFYTLVLFTPREVVPFLYFQF
ncbi:MAG: MBOAT family O-acyltransferase [bacterium]